VKSNDLTRLEQLLRARYPCIFIPTLEDEEAVGLVRDAALRLSYQCRLWSIIGGIRDALVAGQPPIPETEHPAGALFYLTKQADPSLIVLLDLVDHLKDARILRLARDLARHCRDTASHLIFIDHRDELPTCLDAGATRFELSFPDDKELESIVRETLRAQNRERPVNAEISRGTFQLLVRHLAGLPRRRVRQIIIETVAEDSRFNEADLDTVLTRKRQIIHRGGLLEYVETLASMDQIGGMHNLKAWLHRRRRALSEEARAFGISPPRGVLMLGVQGAGKSYCTKAIATAWSRPLFRLDVGALYDKFIGESERRLRDALRQVEIMAPVILWIDEIEKAFASAASHSTDGGLSQRMFGSLLTWMQEHQAPVFLVATANDIGALPPELLRKGRFDEVFFVDLPDEAVRKDIFAIHLTARKRDPKAFDLNDLAKASGGYSGAEIEQAICSALHDAFAAKTDIDTARLRAALEASPPLSVTMAEQIAALRAWAVGRCVRAD